jgi:iron complex outermembrane receptor protein
VRNKKSNALVSAVAAALCTAALPGTTLAAPPEQSRTVTYEIDIPPQDLHAALQQLALVSNHKLFYRSELVSGKSSPAVKGSFTAEQAIQMLLAGTDLTFEITAGDVVLIRGKDEQSSNSQDPSNASQTATEGWRDRVEEIIVTAQKKAQSLQEVPMSVTAIGERSMELAGISNFTDYARMTPGVSFEYAGPGGGQLGDRGVFIRGISSTNTASGGQPVGFYIGETPVPFSDPNLFDINRIEVLRGPQGTLYGASSLGGTVKIVPNSPNSQRFSSKVDSTLSTTKGGGTNYQVRGMANIPVIEDKVAIRATVASRHDEGFIDNAGPSLLCAAPDPACLNGVLDEDFDKNINDVDQLTFRVAAEIRLTDKLTITPSVFAERKEIADRAHYTIGFEDGPGGYLTNVSGPASKEENNFALYDLGVKYDFGPATLTTSTSQMDWKKDNVLGLSYLIQSAFGLPDTTEVGLATAVERDIFTHESRLASTGDDNTLDWLVGVFYQKEEFSFDNYSAEPSLPTPIKLLSAVQSQTTTKQFAAFTEETLHLTDKLSVTGGLRYFRTEVGADRFVTASLLQSPVDFVERLGPTVETGFTPKVAISYEPTEDVLLYALGSRGFRAGGPTRKPANLPACVAELTALGLTPRDSFESDTVWNYETGAKTVWADGKLTANVAGYYIDWNNIQQEIQLNCGFAFSTNFGKASSKGAELELRAAPVRGLDMGVAVGYIDATLSEDSPTGVGKKGDTTLQTPQWTVALDSQYTVPVGFGLSAYVRGNYQYVDDVAITFSTVGVPNGAMLRPSYKIASFSAGLSNDTWEVQVFIQNAFNERPRFESFVDSAGTRFPQAIAIQPQTIGVTARWSF